MCLFMIGVLTVILTGIILWEVIKAFVFKE